MPEPTATEWIESMAIDGSKIRIRTPEDEPSVWRGYKAVNLDTEVVGAFFQQNEELVSWVNRQPLPEIFSCLGDGLDGIWNLFAKIGNDPQRCETLDWYHLVENLWKTDLVEQLKHQIKQLLWDGELTTVVDTLQSSESSGTVNFIPKNIDTASLATIIFMLNRSQLVRTLLNPYSSRLIGEDKFLERNSLKQAKDKLSRRGLTVHTIESRDAFANRDILRQSISFMGAWIE